MSAAGSADHTGFESVRDLNGRGEVHPLAAKFIGYYTLSAFTVELTDLPEALQKKLPRYPRLPATMLGRLARDERFPGTGSLLLMNALKRAFAQSSQIASLAVVADANDDHALAFTEGQMRTISVRDLIEKLNRQGEKRREVEVDGLSAIMAGTVLKLLESVLHKTDPRYAVFINHRLKPVEKASLSMFVADRHPVVIGPNAADDEFIWGLKSEAMRRGSVFEITESKTNAERVLDSLIALWTEGHSPAGTAPNPSPKDPLANLPGIVGVTAQFRTARGRLHADKLRHLFGLSRKEMIDAAGVTISEEAVRTNPDSEKLQPFLEQLEKCARLLVLIKEPAAFAAWLNTSNAELDGKKPIELIRERRVDSVAGLVDDILTNRPG